METRSHSCGFLCLSVFRVQSLRLWFCLVLVCYNRIQQEHAITTAAAQRAKQE